MIPGNHDQVTFTIEQVYEFIHSSQVTLGGTVHALEPLLYAFRPDQILMITEPSVCMGALWIPYRRDTAVMKDVLQFASNGTSLLSYS